MNPNKPLTPQDIFEYKNRWCRDNLLQVDCDSYQWSKDFCRVNFKNYEWDIKKHTKQDDSHTLSFSESSDRDIFSKAYKKRNPRFDIKSY